MALESASWITQFNPVNPTAVDPVGQGDDHLRMIKTVLQNSFPSTSTAAVIPNMSGNAGRVFITDGTDSAWSSVIYIDTLNSRVGVNNVAPTATLDVDGSAIFNESGAAVDFRIEGDTDSNLFFVDGSTDRIGIGTNTPSRKLDVNGDASINTLRIGLGSGNIASNSVLGFQALDSNTTGIQNTAVGYQALRFNTTGNYNNAVGYQSLYNNTTGLYNNAFGFQALTFNTTANYNTAIGHRASYLNETGNSNTAIGYSALFFNVAGYTNTAVGHGALFYNTANNNDAFGHTTLYSNTTGTENSAFGRVALYNNTTGSSNTAVGFQSLTNNTTASGNVAVGRGALYSNTTGGNNTAVGYQSCFSQTTPLNNTAFGYQSLYDCTTGEANVSVGSTAGQNLTTGYNNVLLGNFIASNLTTGFQSVVIGNQAANVGNYSNIVAVGYQALKNNTASNNVAVGIYALYSNTTGTSNTAVGRDALYSNTTGNQNTAVGHSAGSSITSGSNLTVIGYNAEPSSATATNEITLGDANVTDVRIPGAGFYIDNGNVGIGTASPNNKLEIKDGSPGAAIYPLRIKNDANTTGTGAGIEFLADGSYVGGQIYVNRDVSAGPRHSLRFSAFGSPSTGANALTILDNGNVGIGTTNPNQKLTIDGANQYVATQQTPYSWGGSSTIGLKMGTDAIAGALDFRRWIGSATTHGTALITQVYSDGGYGLDFRVDNKSTNTSATTSRMFLSISGEVGIGTTSPAKKLDVAGEIRASNGILFGTDTAAANTLDDYEEGTFTPGIEFGGGTTGITYFTQSGRYTKIGNMVYCDLFVGLSNKGTSTGQFFVTGLPYTVGNYIANTTVEASCSISIFASGNNANQVQGYAYENSTKLSLYDGQIGSTTVLDDTDFNNNTNFRISVAYAV